MSDGIVKILKDAVTVVDEAAIPNDLREAAFSAILAYRGLGEVSSTAAKPAFDRDHDHDPPEAGADSADGVSRIAEKLKLPPEQVGRVFEVEGETVHLLVSSSSLGESKKVQQQELTLLIVGARQAAGIDPDLTSVDDIRAVLSDYGVLDRNFSTSIASFKGARMRFAGPATKREFKMNQPGFEAVAEIVKRLTE